MAGDGAQEGYPYADMSKVGDDLRGDTGVLGLWSLCMMCVFCVVDRDTVSYEGKHPH